jgi:hypothetical protein
MEGYPQSVDMKSISDITKKENVFSKYSWLAFPLFIFWLVGVTMGIYGAKVYFIHKMDEAVKMNRIMISVQDDAGKRNNVVYDLMLFDKTK